MHKTIIILIMSALTPFIHSVEVPIPDNAKTKALSAEHSLLQSILTDVADQHGVDYAILRTQHSKNLDSYRWQLAHAEIPTGNEQCMAFYINAYNALTLALVLHLLPEDKDSWESWSVRKQRGFWKNYSFNVAGKQLSLDTIEHKILRPMGDPRIHFAVNCASVSCPTLRNEAYTGKKLDLQLDEQTQNFLKDTSHIRVENNTLYSNPILDWFGKDFKSLGGVSAFLEQHCPQESVQTYFKTQKRVHFLDYNWNLNHHPRSN